MHQMQINVCGLLDVTSAVLPYMRAQRSGTVVMIGSRSSWETNVPVSSYVYLFPSNLYLIWSSCEVRRIHIDALSHP